MRLLKILLAAMLAASFGTAALAQTMTNNPSASGRLGPIVTGQDINGNTGRFVLNGVTLVNPATGVPYAAAGGSDASVGAVGATAPSSASQAGCVTPGSPVSTGQLVAMRCDGYGGQIGGMMSGTPTRSASLTTSASTALPGAGSTSRPSYLRLTVESALTAPLFLCLSNQTCSATVYDEMIPSGAAAGTRYFSEVPFNLAVTYFTTPTAIVNATRLAN